MLPRGAYVAVARAVMVYLGDAVMDLLTDEAVPAYNMYALFRLAQDVARLRGFADAAGDVPGMAVRAAFPHTCIFLLSALVPDEPGSATRWLGTCRAWRCAPHVFSHLHILLSALVPNEPGSATHALVLLPWQSAWLCRGCPVPTKWSFVCRLLCRTLGAAHAPLPRFCTFSLPGSVVLVGVLCIVAGQPEGGARQSCLGLYWQPRSFTCTAY